MTYILIRTVAILITSYITRVGVIPLVFTWNTAWIALMVALFLAVINHTIKPFIDIVMLPINFFTLGIFSLIINGLIILAASYLVTGFQIPSLLMAIYFSVVLTLVNWMLHIFG